MGRVRSRCLMFVRNSNGFRGINHIEGSQYRQEQKWLPSLVHREVVRVLPVIMAGLISQPRIGLAWDTNITKLKGSKMSKLGVSF